MKLIQVKEADLAAIEGSRCRSFQAVSEALTAETIYQDIRANNRQRVIVIVNRVSFAQDLFRDLRDLAQEIEITLLHSRFLPEHRAEKEAKLKEVFAENWQESDDGICHVLIATQVIEVGLNITCQVLHSQLCPMNSLLQRGGRCARFRGEIGQVFVYRFLELSDAVDNLEEAEKKPNFLPYKSDICELTWEVLLNHTNSPQGEANVGFRLEEEWINTVHRKETLLEKERRQNNRQEFENQFKQAFFKGDESTASELIRDVDSRRIYVWQENGIFLDETEEINPAQLIPFSVPVSFLLRVWDECAEGCRFDWIFKCIENPKKNSKEDYSLPVAVPIKTKSALISSVRILVNPCLVYYDEEVGLLMGIDVANNGFTSPQKLSPKSGKEFNYKMDTYVGHLVLVWKCWRDSFASRREKNGVKEAVVYSSLREELLKAGGKFIQKKILQSLSESQAEDLFEILIFFAILIHDLGKLQTSWQKAMGGWQQIAFTNFGGRNPGQYLLAHTDYDATNPQQKIALRAYESQHKRPNHAVESAFLAQEILQQTLIPLLVNNFQIKKQQYQAICYVVMMAAGRHHSAWTAGWTMATVAKKKPLVLHPQAQQVFLSSWRCLLRFLPTNLNLQTPQLTKSSYAIKPLDFHQFTSDQIAFQQLYALVVRALRLCDGRSVQLL